MTLIDTFEPQSTLTTGSVTLCATDIERSFITGANRIWALRKTSLTFRAGEFICVSGPSGSGKSTLISTLGCLEALDAGGLSICENEVTKLSPQELAAVRRKYIGFIFQDYNLLQRLTLLENTMLPLLYDGVEKKEATLQASAVLNKVGLGDRLEHLPCQLSGGQRQRGAIARATVTESKIIFADEPTGALDTSTGDLILEILESLAAQGRTIVVVSHNEKIAKFADRCFEMSDGHLKELQVAAE